MKNMRRTVFIINSHEKLVFHSLSTIRFHEHKHNVRVGRIPVVPWDILAKSLSVHNLHLVREYVSFVHE